MTSSTHNTDLDYWLAELDQMPLECDGLTRAASTLMHREGVEHTVHLGTTRIDGVGSIHPHLWIELGDGRILDLRARMWLKNSEEAPHGLFVPEPHHHYDSEATLNVSGEHPIIFWALTNRTLEDFPLGFADAIKHSRLSSTKRPGL